MNIALRDEKIRAKRTANLYYMISFLENRTMPTFSIFSKKK